MSFLRSALLTAKNHVVAASRARRLAAMSDQNESPSNVVFYHRVADTQPNDWTISRAQFRQHIDYFQEHFRTVSLSEVQKRVATSQACDPTISVTFDDGYKENVDFALPLLVERKIPCAYFVSTAHILEQRSFTHDEARGAPLAVNSVKELRFWSDAGIEMGCHTRQHVDFGKVRKPSEVRREIFNAKDELEQIIGKPVRYFAFPFGLPAQLTQAAIEAVHLAGFNGFCSAFGGYNMVGRDSFHIRRFHGDPQFSRLVNWCTFDPRKVRCEPKVRYHLSPHGSFEDSTVSANAISSRLRIKQLT